MSPYTIQMSLERDLNYHLRMVEETRYELALVKKLNQNILIEAYRETSKIRAMLVLFNGMGRKSHSMRLVRRIVDMIYKPDWQN